MTKYLIYGIGFFIANLLIQAIVHGISKGKNKKWMIYTGPSDITCLYIIGIMEQEIVFLTAIIGFVVTDEIGKVAGLH